MRGVGNRPSAPRPQPAVAKKEAPKQEATKKQEGAVKKQEAPKQEAAAKKQEAPKQEAAAKKQEAPKQEAAAKKQEAPKQEAAKDPLDKPIDDLANATNAVKIGSDAAAATQTSVGKGTYQVGPLDTKIKGPVAEGLNTRLARGAGAVSTAVAVAQLPGAVYKAVRDTGAALKPGATSQDRNTALNSVSSAVSTGLNAVKGTLEGLGNAADAKKAFSAARSAYLKTYQNVRTLQNGPGREVAERLTRPVLDKAAKAATQAVLRGDDALTAGRVAKSVAQGVMSTAPEALSKATKIATTMASNSAARAAMEAGQSALGKAAGRFAPGLNVAIAAADTVAAVATLRDSEASTPKKAAAVVTAAGSWLAATNIPGLSQGGAVVSTIAGFAGNFL